jgi:hypothetical protein
MIRFLRTLTKPFGNVSNSVACANGTASLSIPYETMIDSPT